MEGCPEQVDRPNSLRAAAGTRRRVDGLPGLALVGGLAYKAWQNYQQGNGQSAGSGSCKPPPADGVFLPQENDAAASNAPGMMIARAMISAAKADGQIDTQERQLILNRINGLDLTAED